MGRTKGSKNKILTGITYPRKCSHCDYISNNPAMYHYHKKTHSSIPENTYCYFGCNCKAEYRNTKGNYTCKEQYSECPAYLLQLSNRSKSSWKNDNARKEKTKKSFIDRLHNQKTVEKMKETKRKKYNTLMPEIIKEYRHYARYIRTKAQQWAKEQGYKIGKQTYHVDHKLSIKDAWCAKLSIKIVNHPANLQIIEAKKNSSKGAKSILTVEELLILIEELSTVSS